MIRAYICHPYSNDPEGNIEKVRTICKEISDDSIVFMDEELNCLDNLGKMHCPYSTYDREDLVVTPIAAHLLFPKFMSEDGGISRDAAMAYCLNLMSACDEVWVCSNNITEGMRREIEFASTWGLPVVFLERD
jgi:hypothetical protein